MGSVNSRAGEAGAVWPPAEGRRMTRGRRAVDGAAPPDGGKGRDCCAKLIGDMAHVPGADFKIGRFAVTQAQWEAVMGRNPSRFKGAERPVENVSWHDCRRFLKRLNALPVVKASGLVFRLPTEDEWEYACRAGGTGAYCRLADGSEVTDGTLGEVAWHGGNAGGETHPVGQKRPNAFGLYDMLGNVWEWTSTADGEYRADRGGGWYNDADGCEAGFRNGDVPGRRHDALGFRLCADVGAGRAHNSAPARVAGASPATEAAEDAEGGTAPTSESSAAPNPPLRPGRPSFAV